MKLTFISDRELHLPCNSEGSKILETESRGLRFKR